MHALTRWRHGALFLALAWFSSCELINPDEPIPVYVNIDSVFFHATLSNQGSSSAVITDAWVYVDDNLAGTFELPARFPLLTEGTHKITVRPGILVNGIKSFRTAYPFYTSFDTTLNCVPGAEVFLSPRSTYTSQSDFILLEDFEQTGLYFTRGPNSDTTLNIINDANSFEGHSGAVYLDPVHSYFNYRTDPPFAATSGIPLYAELNYKCDNEFTVGVVSHVGSADYVEDIVTVRASSTWKKIYVDLSGAVADQPTASGYRLQLTATKGAGLASASIYFDNVKIIQ